MKIIKLLILFLFSFPIVGFCGENITYERDPETFKHYEFKDAIIKFERSIALNESERDLFKRRLIYAEKMLEHTEKIYDTQYYQTWAIFIVVIILVLGGFYLSFLQFKHDIEQNNKSSTTPSSISIGSNGIQLSSSVIGLLVLTISFLFFYLFVKEVYTIQEYRSSNTTQIAK